MNTDTAPATAQGKIQTATEARIETLLEDVQEKLAHIEWLKANQETLDRINIAPTRFLHYIDFNCPNRSQVLDIIKAFPGSWKKNINDNDPKRMDYVRDALDGAMTLRIWGGELPPCCKLVEEWVDVPAQPATRVLRQVVKCPEPLPKTEPELEATI